MGMYGFGLIPFLTDMRCKIRTGVLNSLRLQVFSWWPLSHVSNIKNGASIGHFAGVGTMGASSQAPRLGQGLWRFSEADLLDPSSAILASSFCLLGVFCRETQSYLSHTQVTLTRTLLVRDVAPPLYILSHGQSKLTHKNSRTV